MRVGRAPHKQGAAGPEVLRSNAITGATAKQSDRPPEKTTHLTFTVDDKRGNRPHNPLNPHKSSKAVEKINYAVYL